MLPRSVSYNKTFCCLLSIFVFNFWFILSLYTAKHFAFAVFSINIMHVLCRFRLCVIRHWMGSVYCEGLFPCVNFSVNDLFSADNLYNTFFRLQIQFQNWLRTAVFVTNQILTASLSVLLVLMLLLRVPQPVNRHRTDLEQFWFLMLLLRVPQQANQHRTDLEQQLWLVLSFRIILAQSAMELKQMKQIVKIHTFLVQVLPLANW